VTETASWVFKNHGLVYPAEEDSSEAPEASPVILGSRILSDAPGQDNTGRNTYDLAENFRMPANLRGKHPPMR
jgi:hypothetical protein